MLQSCKGGKVYIEGYLKTEKWTDNNGQDRYTTKIVANEMRMLDSRSEGVSIPQATTQPTEQSGQASTGMIDDDIPF